MIKDKKISKRYITDRSLKNRLNRYLSYGDLIVLIMIDKN